MHPRRRTTPPPLQLRRLSVCAVLLAGCAGASDPARSDGARLDTWSGDVLLRDASPLLPDAPPPDPCAFADGQSCAGGQACPAGLQPVRLADGSCVCRPPCTPGAAEVCGGSACGRVCAPMTDAAGNPIAGAGVCVPDTGQAEGEPCAPAICKLGLECVGPSNARAFCRRTCQAPAECPAYKMVCGEIGGDAKRACVPGEEPLGPAAGEDCAPPSAYCRPELICDPQSRRCLATCNTDDGVPDPCAGQGACRPLVDAATGITLGYGCS